jgi:replicative DNA helicase
MLFAPQGTVKTTLAQRLVLHRIGAREGGLLGYPMLASDRPVLYLAMDRPRQASRSMRRMVTEEDRELLDERLVVWRGPVAFDTVKQPERLATWISDEFEAGTVIVDSLKDLAPGLSKDEVGSALNLAFGYCTAGGIEVVTLHHPRKSNAENKEPTTLDDVYGSTWLTSGAGSVIGIHGEQGDTLLNLRHLKQPEDPVGPFTIKVDHESGEVVRTGAREPLGVLREAGLHGVDVYEVAAVCRGSTEKTAAQWARRELQKLHQRGLATLFKGEPRQHEPDIYVDSRLQLRARPGR